MTITTGKHTVLHIYIYIDQSSAVRFYEKAYLQSRKKKRKKNLYIILKSKPIFRRFA